MNDPQDGELHVWSDEKGDYYIARDRTQLSTMVDASLAEASFVALPDDYNLTLTVGGEDDDDGMEEDVTKTCAEWVAAEGAGHLGSGTHYGATV